MDTEKISELLLDTAWKSLEFTQQKIEKIEDKANNLMTFSGVLMTLNAALIIEFKDSIPSLILLSIEMFFLIKSVWYGYGTIKLRETSVLDMVGVLRTIDLTDNVRLAGDLAVTFSNRQQELLNLINDKSSNLKKSMEWFTLSLGFLMLISFFYLLSALSLMIESSLKLLCPNL